MKKLILLIAVMAIMVCPVVSKAATAISENEVGAFAGAASNTSFTTPQIPLQSQPIYPYLLQMVPGVVGDVTDRPEMPSFAGILPLQKTDKVVKIDSYTRGGRIAGFSRLEDFDSDLLDCIPKAMATFKQKNTDKIRFKVLFKMSVKSIGSGGGAGGGASGFTNTVANPVAWAANGSILPGVAVNTSDPKFILKFYLIQ